MALYIVTVTMTIKAKTPSDAAEQADGILEYAKETANDEGVLVAYHVDGHPTKLEHPKKR